MRGSVETTEDIPVNTPGQKARDDKGNRPSLACQSPLPENMSLQMFHREAVLWKGLLHEHVVPFLGVSEDAIRGSPCMVLPWYESGSLREHLPRMHMNNEWAGDGATATLSRWVSRKFSRHGYVAWLTTVQFTHIVLGLEYLHSEGIIHGDLHGGNILINEKNNACLTDFGLSLFADATAYNYGSVHGGGAGRYRAPELSEPEEFNQESSRPTCASDIFSLACTGIEVGTVAWCLALARVHVAY